MKSKVISATSSLQDYLIVQDSMALYPLCTSGPEAVIAKGVLVKIEKA